MNNEANQGTCSLKANAIANSQKAQIQFAGTFVAGNITFDRKVSSEPGWDCFRFFIDDVPQAVGGTCSNIGLVGASGEVAWGAVSVPITAGMHTVKWSYEKDTTDVSGQDTAWIDSVVLPLVPKKSSLPAIILYLLDD